MIEIFLKYDNMHKFGIINAFICINNHVISCINSMLSCIALSLIRTPKLSYFLSEDNIRIDDLLGNVHILSCF